MTTRRASVSALPSRASGAGTVRAATPPRIGDLLRVGPERGLCAEEFRPVGGAVEVGSLGGDAVQAPGAVVREVAITAESKRRRCGLDLRSLLPFVEGRDRDSVGAGRERRVPHRVVGPALL